MAAAAFRVSLSAADVLTHASHHPCLRAAFSFHLFQSDLILIYVFANIATGTVSVQQLLAVVYESVTILDNINTIVK